MAMMMDVSIPLSEKRRRLNEQLAAKGLPTYATDDEFLYDVLKGNRTDAEFQRDLSEAEKYLRLAEESSQQQSR